MAFSCACTASRRIYVATTTIIFKTVNRGSAPEGEAVSIRANRTSRRIYRRGRSIAADVRPADLKLWAVTLAPTGSRFSTRARRIGAIADL